MFLVGKPDMPKVPIITSLQYLAIFKKKVRGKFDLLFEDEHQSFLPADNTIAGD